MKVLAPVRVIFGLQLILLVLSFSCVAEQQRKVEPIEEIRPHQSENGKFYAIIIGIDHYPKSMPTLLTAVNDAKAVADVLTRDYGFEITLLLEGDATRNRILDGISSLHDKLNDNDSLLIYYAGHGYLDRTADKAYWIPVDADSIYSSNRIIADDLTADVRGLSARHVLIISDSCYSGGLTRSIDAPLESAGRMPFLSRMLRNQSRTLMSSGGDEPVADGGAEGHSVFAHALLQSLANPRQAIFTGSDLLYGSVRQQVAGKSTQVPQYAFIRNSNDEQGDFVFVRKGTDLSQVQSSSAQLSTADQSAPALTSDSFIVVRAPVGSEIQIDQELAGHSNGDPLRIKVSQGKREVSVYKIGFQPWKRTVEARSGSPVEVAANLEPVASSGVAGPTPNVGALSEKDMLQIRDLLNRYASAVNGRDAKQLKSAWPEISSRKVDQIRALPKGARISLTITAASMLDTNENAIVRSKQIYELEGKSDEDNVTFYLGRLNGGWIINQIPSSN